MEIDLKFLNKNPVTEHWQEAFKEPLTQRPERQPVRNPYEHRKESCVALNPKPLNPKNPKP